MIFCESERLLAFCDDAFKKVSVITVAIAPLIGISLTSAGFEKSRDSPSFDNSTWGKKKNPTCPTGAKGCANLTWTWLAAIVKFPSNKNFVPAFTSTFWVNGKDCEAAVEILKIVSCFTVSVIGAIKSTWGE